MRYYLFYVILFPLFIFSHSSKTAFELFPNYYFIETGSHLGYGIETALETKGFKKIISIELSPYFSNFCKKKFKSNENITILDGDSSIVLKRIMRKIDHQATFWLDGHYSGGNTAKGKLYSPIIAELEAIKCSTIKNHVILIDDVRCMGTCDFDFVSVDQIIEKIREINPNYKIMFLDCPAAKGDILAAYIEQ